MAEQGSNSLYVGTLPRDIDEEKLYHLFQSEHLPQIASLRIVRSPDGAKAPYAYLNFHTAEDADKVLKEAGFKVYNGQDLILQKFGKPGQLPTDANVYASGDFSGVETKDVYAYFTQQFACASFKPRVANYSGKTSFYIQYEKSEDAAAVIKKVTEDNGLVIADKTVPAKVELFKKSTERGHQTNVFIRNFPVNYTADQLKDLVSKYGEVDSIYIPERFPTKPGETGPSKTGFGFANYKSPDQAKSAIEKLNQEVIGDYKLAAFFAVTKDHRSRQVKYASDKFQQNHTTQRQPFKQRRPYPYHQPRAPRLAKAIIIKPTLTEEDVRSRLVDLQIKNVQERQFGTIVIFLSAEDARQARERLKDIARYRYQLPPRRMYSYPRYPRGYPPYPYHQMMQQYPHPMMQQYAHPHMMQQPHPQQGFNTRRRNQREHQRPQQPHQTFDGQVLSEEERQNLGSQLYYKIQALVQDNDTTGKITGMLLELSAQEVRQLAQQENSQLLQDKVKEATDVLNGVRQQ